MQEHTRYLLARTLTEPIEVAVAVHVLNCMLELGRPTYVRVA